jgi:hypothetical protein
VGKPAAFKIEIEVEIFGGEFVHLWHIGLKN